MCSSFGLLHPVALHDLAVAVDADVPGATRLGLAIQHGRVRNIVVLKHALLEFTLRSEVLLESRGGRCIRISKQSTKNKNANVRRKQHFYDPLNMNSSTCEYTLAEKVYERRQWKKTLSR